MFIIVGSYISCFTAPHEYKDAKVKCDPKFTLRQQHTPKRYQQKHVSENERISKGHLASRDSARSEEVSIFKCGKIFCFRGILIEQGCLVWVAHLLM